MHTLTKTLTQDYSRAAIGYLDWYPKSWLIYYMYLDIFHYLTLPGHQKSYFANECIFKFSKKN